MQPHRSGFGASGRPRRAAVKRPITLDDRERDVVFLFILVVLLLTTVPHLFGYAYAPAGYRFIGMPFNIPDYLVYLSWVYQTAHGHFFIRDLFTTDTQPLLLFNFLISAMGLIARVTHLEPRTIIELTRALGAAGLLWLIYRFYCACLPSNRAARLTAFGFACFGSGFGWTVWRVWRDKNINAPLEAWQPEAYTFSSIYMNFLFVISTILILAVLYSLLLAARTGQTRYAVLAGGYGFILGDIHSYDILHISAAWGLFLVVWTIIRRARGVGRLWLQSLLALAMVLPTTLFVYHVMTVNAVFRARADSPTLTPSLARYADGYGFMGIFAVLGVILIAAQYFRARTDASVGARHGEPPATHASPALPASAERIAGGWADWPTLLFVLCWIVAAFIAAELKFEFQRKMIMGLDIPLSLVAGWGAAAVTQRLSRTARIVCLALLVAATFPSNAFLIARDIAHIRHNTSETTTWPIVWPTLAGALDYIDAKTPANAAVLSLPDVAAYVPAFTGRAVWAGHWSETPDYADRVNAIGRFANPDTSDADRIALLRSAHVQYLLYPNDARALTLPVTTRRVERTLQFYDFVDHPRSYLKPVYKNKDFTIFKIDIP